MNLPKRIKRMWQLSSKDPKAIDKLTNEEIEAIPDEGDGKAVFLGEGSHEEFLEQQKEDKGFKNIFGIGL